MFFDSSPPVSCLIVNYRLQPNVVGLQCFDFVKMLFDLSGWCSLVSHHLHVHHSGCDSPNVIVNLHLTTELIVTFQQLMSKLPQLTPLPEPHDRE